MNVKERKLQLATRKSKLVTDAIKKMRDAGVFVAGLTWEDVWDDIVRCCDARVYLIGKNDAVWGYFPCPSNKIHHGIVTLSTDDVPYLWLDDGEIPIEGEILIQPSGAKYYLFLDGDRLGEDLDGYLCQHGEWQCTKSHQVHWGTVREAGV